MIAALTMAAAVSLVSPPVITHRGPITVVMQPDANAMIAGTSLFVRAGLDRQSFSQNGLAALTAQTILQTPVDGKPLTEAITDAGGSIDETTERADARFYVEGLGSDLPHLLDLFARALHAPDFSAATVARARLALANATANRGGLTMGVEMLDGTPADGTAVSLAQFIPDDVRAFYVRTYRTGGAIISTAGAIDPAGSYDGIASALQTGASEPADQRIPVIKGRSHQLIAHRDIDVAWLIARYPAPPVTGKDYGAMLVLSSFVDGTLASLSQVPTLISRTSADSAVGSIYAFDTAAPTYTVYLYGGLGQPAQAFSTAIEVFKTLGSAPILGSLDTFKAAARGRFATLASSIEDRSWLAGVFAANGGDGDYLNRTFAAIDATSAVDVSRVARRYLGEPTVALVLPRDST